MLNQTTLVNVTNIGSGTVVYSIPELNIKREYFEGQTKPNISVKEVRALHSMPGGDMLLKDYLYVDNDELLEELEIEAPLEAKWNRKTVEAALLTGSLDVVKDALEFGPQGIKDQLRDAAVALEIPDMSKREAIKEATGFDVTQGIRINAESKVTDEEPKTEEKSAGRRAATAEPEAPKRRAAEETEAVTPVSKYKRV